MKFVKMIKKYLKENYLLILLSLLIITLSFGTYLIRYHDFVLGYDFQYQHLLFYDEFNRLIKSGQLPFWSKNMFLGGNFWSSKTYYLLGDPFAYLTLLFPKEYMTYALMITYILKLLTAILLFNHLLEKMNIKKKYRILGSLLYGFCGWSALFMEHPNFLVWHTFLPLVLIGIESILKDKKYGTFVLGIFLVAISNYYFLFTTSIFLTIYWTIRYIQLNKFIFKDYILSTLKLIGFYIIGIGISAVFLLPSIIYLFNNSRVGSEVVITNKWNPVTIYLDMIVKSLIPPFKSSELNHMLFSTTDYNTNQLTIYSSVLTIILLPQIFKQLKNKEMKGYLAFLIILFVFICFPIFSSVLHGLNTPNFRWTLLFITIEILTAVHILENGNIDKKLLFLSSGIIVALVIILLIVANNMYEAIWDHLKPEYNALIISGVISILYSLLLSKKLEKVLLTLVIIELSLSFYLTMDRYPEFQDFDYNNLLSNEAIDYVKSIEDKNSFYRIYVPYEESNAAMPHNINYYYDYMSAYTYDSLYEGSAAEYADKVMHNYYNNSWQLNITDMDLLEKLSFKYIVTKSNNFYLGKSEYTDKTIDLNNYPNKYKLIKEIDGYKIYQIINTESFPFELTTFKDNSINGTRYSNNGENITLPISYDSGWKIKINGNNINYSDNNGLIYIPLKSGTNNLEMSFIPNGFIPGIVISFISIISYIVIRKKIKI